MIKDDCIFCKLANGVFPTATIYEDDEFRVILDKNPASYGHALVLPKEHFDNVYTMDEDTAGKVFAVAAKVAKAEKEQLGCDGVNILQNNEETAGQTVFHFHMHVIPRYKNDTVSIGWKPEEAGQEQIDEIVRKLENNIR
jgi:histidine triad (HIT) family protein